MHPQSIVLMKDFAATYYKGGAVLDVGSRNVNGTYRDLFPKGVYHGIDWQAGDGVDTVVEGWGDWPIGMWDTIISGQALEHDGMFWLTLKNMAKHLNPGGYMCIIVPAEIPLHRYPVDCYRFKADAMYAWAAWMKLKLIEARTVGRDTIGVFKNEDQSNV